ncbi:hypothetical protein [Phytohalomonas tamaricis]|uniref:hypothetical protein n=1 Tax=Phytohalomonas tamaricis TaxID=2081032 RepID=UPI000D0BB2E0|nr:hypothetical protein [Phytohalomonas tamaricis]
MNLIVVALTAFVAPVLIVLAYLADGLSPRSPPKQNAGINKYLVWRDVQAREQNIITIDSWREKS